MLNLRCVVRGLLCVLMLMAGSARAVDMTYEASNLANDRWRYSYTLSGRSIDSIAQFAGVTLIFPVASYAGLVLDSVPDAADFVGALTQPDSALPGDGLLSLTANRVIDAETFHFSVSFDWLGLSPPGSQPYEIFDDNFSITGSGETTLIPEPAAWLLTLAGLAGLVAVGRRRHAHGVAR
ncbi:MAG: PEP-CTERM sorting domain-containing protein [Burkholderiaceae bacterium]|nr:PEP-CTERM sorting domain-containing protein [Burkholderiaceae bacterium]